MYLLLMVRALHLWLLFEATLKLFITSFCSTHLILLVWDLNPKFTTIICVKITYKSSYVVGFGNDELLHIIWLQSCFTLLFFLSYCWYMFHFFFLSFEVVVNKEKGVTLQTKKEKKVNSSKIVWLLCSFGMVQKTVYITYSLLLMLLSSWSTSTDNNIM